MPASHPVVFVDAAGARWYPVLSDAVASEVRDNFGINLDALERSDPSRIPELLFQDLTTLGVCLLMACYRQAGWPLDRARGADGLAFIEATRADDATLDRATEALLFAVARRYPTCPAIRAMVRALPAWRRSQSVEQNPAPSED